MTDSDSEPLLDDLGGVDDAPNSPNVDFTKMVFFYGKVRDCVCVCVCGWVWVYVCVYVNIV